jgi:hypothetical protein
MPARYAEASNKVFHSRILLLDTPAVKATTTNEVSRVPNKQRLTERSATRAIFSERASSELAKYRHHTANNRRPANNKQQTPNNKPNNKQ